MFEGNTIQVTLTDEEGIEHEFKGIMGSTVEVDKVNEFDKELEELGAMLNKTFSLPYSGTIKFGKVKADIDMLIPGYRKCKRLYNILCRTKKIRIKKKLYNRITRILPYKAVCKE
mgnify:CR=1 FL=1